MRPPAPILTLAGLLLALPSVLDAANHFVEARPDNTFFPRDLVIQVGDTVTWTNAGGFHNVEATSGASFRCAEGCDGSGGNGSPSASAWSFSLTFDNPAVINYVCEAHAAVGMVGTVTVQGGAPDDPGNLRFAVASQQRGEGSGSFNVQVTRVGGDDGAVSVDYATTPGSAQNGSDFTPASGTLTWADNDDDPKTFQVAIVDDGEVEGNETLTVMLSNPGGGAGLTAPSTSTLTIVDDDSSAPTPGNLGFVSSTFQTAESGGTATIAVTRTGGTDGAVSVDYATADGSAQAGSDYTPAAGTLSWADGDGATKSFTVAVLDDAVEEGDETVNLTLSNPSGGAGLGTSSATLTVADDDGTGGACTADARTLCLNQDGRFQVRVRWADFAGAEDDGLVVDIGRRDSGLVYFFDANNIEMLIKVLDGCSLNDRYWVFYAATTNVGFEITVTDTLTDTVQTYGNALGNPAAPVLDTSAFATCP